MTTAPAAHLGLVDYPLLGEPFVVEFVNTLYVDAAGTTDFLATVDLARGWFGSIDPAIHIDPNRVDESARQRLVDLRTAVRELFDATDPIDRRAAVAVVEAAVNTAPGRVALIVDEHDRLTRRTVFDTTDPDGAAAFLADAAISVVTAPESGRVLICRRPACNMRFFKQHGRRRYCNPACANSDRQTRFQQRHKN